jgi:hypothetical protein
MAMNSVEPITLVKITLHRLTRVHHKKKEIQHKRLFLYRVLVRLLLGFAGLRSIARAAAAAEHVCCPLTMYIIIRQQDNKGKP